MIIEMIELVIMHDNIQNNAVQNETSRLCFISLYTEKCRPRVIMSKPCTDYCISVTVHYAASKTLYNL